MKNSYCWYSLLTVNKQLISEDTKQAVMDEIETNGVMSRFDFTASSHPQLADRASQKLEVAGCYDPFACLLVILQ